MSKTLTKKDFCRAAEKLGCEVAAIQAIAEQEAPHGGFYPNGFPTILFERHLFHKYTHGKYDAHSNISSASPGGYGPSASQPKRFDQAFALDANAAMMACSWGKFQILGLNFAICGFPSVNSFVDAMKESEGRQMDAFCEFVLHNHLDDFLTNHNWAGFARGYNGKNYKINQYDVKIGQAYRKFSRNPIDCSQEVSGAALDSIPPAEIPAKTASEEQTSPTTAPETVVPVAAISAEPVDTVISKWSARFTAIPAMVVTLLTGIWAWIQNSPTNLVITIAIIGGVIAVAYITVKQITSAVAKHRADKLQEIREAQAFELQKLTMQSAMRKDLNAVQIVQPPTIEIQNSDPVTT